MYYLQLTSWNRFDHQLREVLLLKLLEHRVRRSATTLGCRCSCPSAGRTITSATSPPPTTRPGRCSCSRLGKWNGNWKKLRWCWCSTVRKSRSSRGCRWNILWRSLSHRVNRSPNRQKQVRLRGREKSCV